MDPSSIIAQVDKDTTPVASAKLSSNNGSATEKTRKGNMKKHLAILRDRLFCCVRANVPPPAEPLTGRNASKSHKRTQIYNPPGKGNNVTVLRRNNYHADNGASVSEHSESVNSGRSDMPLLAGENGCDFVTCESVVLSESPRDDGSNNKVQQGRGVLYEVHLSTTTVSSSSPGRHSSPTQVATPASNGEMSFSNENVRNRPSSSYTSGAANGPPTSSTPLTFSAANNNNGNGNGARTPQVFSPSPISGVIPSAPPIAPGRRGVVTYQQSECAITINSVGQTSTSATSQSFSLLLGAPLHEDRHRPCLIIDLDETLVHSSFKPIPNADFIVPVEIDGTIYQVYVQKRPHVDEFLQRVGKIFECVLFTASLAKYADPVADLLDKWGVFRARLFREACVFYRGNYVKDLGQLGRELDCVAIIDNSPASYLLHPENAIPVTSWFDDPNDIQLLELMPILERLAACLAPGVRQAGTRELLRELIGPVPQVSPLAPPTPNGSNSGNSVVTSAANPNTQQQQDSGVASNSVTPNSSSSSSASSSSSVGLSPPSSPFSPQPVQLVVVGPTVHTTSTIHHINPSQSNSTNSSTTRTQLRTARYNVQ